jgi:GntR family transcriptional regulator, transcriptional repressor for pyruvate dehydrogenase complex
MTNQPFKRVKGIRLSDQAVEQIQALIMDGQIEPGTKLPSEGELASQLQISRASIREALRVLESRGVIQVRSGSGAYVSDLPFSFNALTDALEWLVRRKETLVYLLAVREVLEGFASSLLAQQVSGEVVEKLRVNLNDRKEVSAGSRDVDQLSAIDLEFHQIIADNCGNPVATVIIQSILSQICCSNRAIVRVSGGSDISTAEHQAIVEALQACDPVQAEQAMRSHLGRVRRELAEIHEQGDAQAKDAGVMNGI